ncbi:MAG: HpcH/HpaI aldolase family protein [Polaromonas sp.]
MATTSNRTRPLDTRLSALLRGQKTLRAVFNGIPSPAIVEMSAYAGFDFVIIDNEHGTSGLETTENMLRAALASGMPAAVRCLEQDIARTLDAGAGALQIPMVNTAAHAARLVQLVKYPLATGALGISGQRGAAFSTRAAGYGAFGGPEHVKASNEGVALIVMVETPEGVANAAAIAAVDGVDAVFIGPNDLAHSMGHQNSWTDAPVQAAMRQAIEAIAASGKCAGVLALTQEEELRYKDWGARFFATVTTGLIMRAFKDAAQGGRAKLDY